MLQNNDLFTHNSSINHDTDYDTENWKYIIRPTTIFVKSLNMWWYEYDIIKFKKEDAKLYMEYIN